MLRHPGTFVDSFAGAIWSKLLIPIIWLKSLQSKRATLRFKRVQKNDAHGWVGVNRYRGFRLWRRPASVMPRIATTPLRESQMKWRATSSHHGMSGPCLSFDLIWGLSYNTTFSKELWISSFPLYLI
jgi:hypothetical protein